MSSATKTVTALLNAPLPAIVRMLGQAVADAQHALDQNSIATALQMAESRLELGGRSLSLIELGFLPPFYAFTDTTIEARMAFTVTEETTIGVTGKVEAQIGVVAVSVEASYARKFGFSAEGSSAIATRLTSVPPPPLFLQVITELSTTTQGE
jgi:hypothetical protein